VTKYDLAERVALVTGGSRGIGKGIAERLAYCGADVVVASRHSDGANAVATSIAEKYGTRAFAFSADVSRVDDIEALIRSTIDVAGRLDILVNNAGISPRIAAWDVTEESWNAILDTNLKGAFFCAREAARQMRKQGGGRIINIGSVHSASAMKLHAPYGASKAGLSQLTRVLALEWGEDGILVNCVAPGCIPTDINREALANPEHLQRNISRTAVKRLGTTDDIAAAVAFLSSDDARYITGETIYVDGGWTI